MTTARPRKPPTDSALTPTQRAKAHLERLAKSAGKRVVVDLGEIECTALEVLVERGYGGTQSDVIRRAIVEAAERQETGTPPVD
jgi:hypothetical protein